MKKVILIFTLICFGLTACGTATQNPQASTQTALTGYTDTPTFTPTVTSTPTRTPTPQKSRLEDLIISREQLGDIKDNFQRFPYFQQAIAPDDAMGVGESIIGTFINLKNNGNVSIYIVRCVDNKTAHSLITLVMTLLQGQPIESAPAAGLADDEIFFSSGMQTGVIFTYQELLLAVTLDDQLLPDVSARLTSLQEIASQQLQKIETTW